MLSNAYKHDEPTATALIKTVSLQCPALFYSILPKSEQISLDGSVVEDDDEDEISVVANEQHYQPTVTRCIKQLYVRSQYRLPTRGIQLHDGHVYFSNELSQAYGIDYNKPNIIMFSSTFT